MFVDDLFLGFPNLSIDMSIPYVTVIIRCQDFSQIAQEICFALFSKRVVIQSHIYLSRATSFNQTFFKNFFCFCNKKIFASSVKSSDKTPGVEQEGPATDGV